MAEREPPRHPRITVDPQMMGGLPCIRGMRMPVSSIVGKLADGMTTEEILADHPELEPEDIAAALAFAAEAAGERRVAYSGAA